MPLVYKCEPFSKVHLTLLSTQGRTGLFVIYELLYYERKINIYNNMNHT